MKKFLVFLAAAALLAGGGMFCSEEEEDEKAYVRFYNNTATHEAIADISGAGATWAGSYAYQGYTEQKEVETGNHNVTWTCGGNPYNKFVDVEEGSWLLRINDCAAASVDTIEE
ncbi:MAG: DUF4397 domain-containing protein [Spirochaetes bacterium]|nr:DUF4397 domain-containing protein [Spirochaetota bacterium]